MFPTENTTVGVVFSVRGVPKGTSSKTPTHERRGVGGVVSEIQRTAEYDPITGPYTAMIPVKVKSLRAILSAAVLPHSGLFLWPIRALGSARSLKPISCCRKDSKITKTDE